MNVFVKAQSDRNGQLRNEATITMSRIFTKSTHRQLAIDGTIHHLDWDWVTIILNLSIRLNAEIGREGENLALLIIRINAIVC